MYTIIRDHKLNSNSEAKYYGIGDFVNASSKKEGTPGTFQSDQEFEDLIKEKSKLGLREHISDKLETDSKVDTFTIFYGALLLYIKAFLLKKGFNYPLETPLGKICDRLKADITFKAVHNIDAYSDEKGHMVLIRYKKLKLNLVKGLNGEFTFKFASLGC